MLHFLHSNVPDNKFHRQNWCMLIFTRIKLVMHVLACACAYAIACIKLGRLNRNHAHTDDSTTTGCNTANIFNVSTIVQWCSCIFIISFPILIKTFSSLLLWSISMQWCGVLLMTYSTCPPRRCKFLHYGLEICSCSSHKTISFLQEICFCHLDFSSWILHTYQDHIYCTSTFFL